MKPQAICVAIAIMLFGPPASAQWVQCNGPYERLNVNCLAISGSNLFAGTEGGVFLTTNNGTSWTEVNTSLGYRPPAPETTIFHQVANA